MSYEPPFTKTNRIDELVFEVIELFGEFNASSMSDPKPWLHRKMRVKTIHSSLAIEGNRLAEGDVEGIIDGQKVIGDPKDILEVKNANKAYSEMDELNPYSMNDLLKAHRLLMHGLVKEAGRFRSSNVGVYDGDVLIHAGTPAKYVPEVMNDLFKWIASTELHPLISSSIFHFEFEFIHPFADGNGRCGRLWHTLLLSKWREAFKWLPIESAILSRQQDYYYVLAASDRCGSSEAFVGLMLEIIRDSLKDQLHSEGKRTKNGQNALLFFRQNPSATVADLAEFLEVSPRTAFRVVKELRDAGQLRRIGSNKTGHWECE